jgi:mycofactocin precursor
MTVTEPTAPSSTERGATDVEETTAPAVAGGGADEALVTEELLVEEISIDGMCGVY